MNHLYTYVDTLESIDYSNKFDLQKKENVRIEGGKTKKEKCRQSYTVGKGIENYSAFSS